jgi:hypothetical protein
MTKGDIRDVWETNRKRLERKRETEREWAKANRDKVNAYRAAARATRAAEQKAMRVKSAYHADWKGTTYQCPELTYRGLA